MNKRLYLSPPHMGGHELEFVGEAFDTNWVAPAGPHITAFEHALGTYLENYSVAALSSGTAAIHLALIILGVKSDDEVLCSSFTFSGSCNPIVYLGARPVFVDSEPETWNMDPELLEEAILDRISKTSKKPAALIVVHLYGMPAKMNEIIAIARKYEIPIIEDAAEALGSLYMGKKCGTLGDVGILSFNGNKIITTSGGGALVSKNSEWIEKAKFLSTQARDPAPHYEHSEIGYNYRLSNVCAGIGRGQMEVLENRVEQRRGVFVHYQRELRTGNVRFLNEPEGHFSNRWLTTILLESGQNCPETVRLHLETFDIETRPLWKPMHLQPVFKDAPAYINGVSEGLFNKGVCLPSGSAMSQQQVEFVCEKIKDLVKG